MTFTWQDLLLILGAKDEDSAVIRVSRTMTNFSSMVLALRRYLEALDRGDFTAAEAQLPLLRALAANPSLPPSDPALAERYKKAAEKFGGPSLLDLLTEENP